MNIRLYEELHKAEDKVRMLRNIIEGKKLYRVKMEYSHDGDIYENNLWYRDTGDIRVDTQHYAHILEAELLEETPLFIEETGEIIRRPVK